MILANDLKRGMVIQLDQAPCLVLDVSFQSPSARGGSTLVKTKYRNLLTGQVLEKSFKAVLSGRLCCFKMKFSESIFHSHNCEKALFACLQCCKTLFEKPAWR